MYELSFSGGRVLPDVSLLQLPEVRPVHHGRIEWYAMVWVPCDRTPGCEWGREHSVPCHVNWELMNRAQGKDRTLPS